MGSERMIEILTEKNLELEEKLRYITARSFIDVYV